MSGLGDMLDIPQQNPLKYGFSGIEMMNKLWLVGVFNTFTTRR